MSPKMRRSACGARADVVEWECRELEDGHFWALLAAVVTILIGQLLYVPGRLLPETSVTNSPFTSSLNQIFLEDIATAVAFVRFRSALGERRFIITILVVAFGFSAAHYPLKLSEGLSFFLATLEVLIDGALAAAVIYVVQRSRDIVWFWFVHFGMDMMQFYAP